MQQLTFTRSKVKVTTIKH